MFLKVGGVLQKSSHIALILVLSLILEPVNIVCFRKVGETLSKSVYEQIKWAIQFLGAEEYFRFKSSPLEIIYVERGNKFIFLGVDDPQKSKSIKTADYPIAYFGLKNLLSLRQKQKLKQLLNLF